MIYYATLKQVSYLTVKVDMWDDANEPTEEDILDAARYVDNHMDTFIEREEILGIELMDGVE